MSQIGTVLTQVKIDVSPKGIRLTFEGIDTDLAELMQSAGTFSAQPIEFHTFDTSDIVIKSDKVLTFVDPPTN